MQEYKMLVLTDHSGHSKENSLYQLVNILREHPQCLHVDVASRATPLNDLFFKEHVTSDLFVKKADENFRFQEDGAFFKEGLKKVSLSEYDVIWLRLPPPLSEAFLGFLIQEFPTQLLINDPSGIYETGSKAFLLNFPELCPPMKLCRSVQDVKAFKANFPIVLKPLRDYGGRGIIKIDGEKIWEGKKEFTFEAFTERMQNRNMEYLGVQYLKNVTQGDKRVVVVHGRIMGASLRLPAKDSWLCNVAMGGTSNYTEVDEDEIKIVERINPTLSKMGIVMYGVDTLVNDEGKRVLSEINTTSIGGLPQIAALSGKPLLKEASDLIWQYINDKIKTEDVITNA